MALVRTNTSLMKAENKRDLKSGRMGQNQHFGRFPKHDQIFWNFKKFVQHSSFN